MLPYDIVVAMLKGCLRGGLIVWSLVTANMAMVSVETLPGYADVAEAVVIPVGSDLVFILTVHEQIPAIPEIDPLTYSFLLDLDKNRASGASVDPSVLDIGVDFEIVVEFRDQMWRSLTRGRDSLGRIIQENVVSVFFISGNTAVVIIPSETVGSESFFWGAVVEAAGLFDAAPDGSHEEFISPQGILSMQ